MRGELPLTERTLGVQLLDGEGWAVSDPVRLTWPLAWLLWSRSGLFVLGSLMCSGVAGWLVLGAWVIGVVR